MIAEEPKRPRAERFVAIVDASLEAWAAHWPIYLGLAFASIALQFCVAAAAHYYGAALFVAGCVFDGFVTAFVTIDVAERFREEPRRMREVFRASLVRWPLVTAVVAATSVVAPAFSDWVFVNADQTYGVGILPGLVAFGILGIATVVASIDDTRPWYLLPGYAFVRSIVLSGIWPNLGRLLLAGAMVAVPMMLQLLLQQWLPARGLHAGENLFWSFVPVDALTLAPFQAFFTYLYFDFVAREAAKR